MRTWPGGLAPQGELVAARAAARPSGHERRRAGRPVSHPRAAARQARRSEARASGRVYTCWLSTLMCVPPKRYVNVTLTVFALSQPSQVHYVPNRTRVHGTFLLAFACRFCYLPFFNVCTRCDVSHHPESHRESRPTLVPKVQRVPPGRGLWGHRPCQCNVND